MGERDVAMDAADVSRVSTPRTADTQPRMYPVSAMGGTFDHLHAGHKILLSMAAWITSEKLIIGMTGRLFLQMNRFK